LKKSLILILALFFMLPSCTSVDLGDYMPYEDIPDDYGLEDAKNDGCLVFENSSVTSGQTAWESFLRQSNKKSRVLSDWLIIILSASLKAMTRIITRR